jgi:hypothetical protein
MGCLRVLVWAFIFFLFLGGIFLAGISAWNLTSPTSFNLANLEGHIANSSTTALKIVDNSIYFSLTFGILIAVLGLFGCVGAWQRNRCMLNVYSAIIGVLLIFEFSVVILALVNYPKVEEILKKSMEQYNTTSEFRNSTSELRNLTSGFQNSTQEFWNSTAEFRNSTEDFPHSIENSLNSTDQSENWDSMETNELDTKFATEFWDGFHTAGNCCGLYGREDWENLGLVTPKSCENFTIGCSTVIKTNGSVLGGIVGGVILIQIMALIASRILHKKEQCYTA